MSDIIPGFSVFVDEAGTLDFNAPLTSGKPIPLVYCATVLPSAEREKLIGIIPQSRDGSRLLKSSDRELTEEAVTEFVRSLFQLDVYCGLAYVNAGDTKTLEVVKDAHAATNAKRSKEHKRHLSPATVLYYLFIADAVARAVGAYFLKQRAPLNYTDLVLDSQDLPRQLYGEVRSSLRTHFKKVFDLQFRTIEWVSELTEPLLFVPDLLAGIPHRRATAGGLFDAYAIVESQIPLKRVQIQDGRELHRLPGRERT